MLKKIKLISAYAFAIISLLIIALGLFVINKAANAQNNYLYDEKQCKKLERLPAQRLIEIEEIFETLIEASGKKGNFFLCPIVQQDGAFAVNAPALEGNVVFQGQFIGYNSRFMSVIRERIGYWGETAIIAHELGHHVLGHTLIQGESNPKIELEADYFAGQLMQKTGASLNNALFLPSQPFMQNGGTTHPDGQQRIDAFNAGWLDGCKKHPTNQCPHQKPAPPNKIIDDPNYLETFGYLALLEMAQQLKGKQITKRYCKQYVDVSLQQVKRNHRHHCGNLIDSYDSSRWSTNDVGQFKWCMSASAYASEKEAIFREKQLKQCIKSQQ